MKRLQKHLALIVLAFAGITLLGVSAGYGLRTVMSATHAAPTLAAGPLAADEVRERTIQYIEWDANIQLTSDEEAIKKEALEAIPAACCSDNSAYTCCCPCNLSRTVWGLSNHMIQVEKKGVEEVRAAVKQWIADVNPNGFGGDACYTGGCGRPYHQDGCGGMSPSSMVF